MQPKPDQADARAQKLRPVYLLAQAHCANFCKGGFCEGAGVDLKTGRHFRWRNAGLPCLLAVGQRCPYFEQSVLPMETRKDSDWKPLSQGVAFREAAAKVASVDSLKTFMKDLQSRPVAR